MKTILEILNVFDLAIGVFGVWVLYCYSYDRGYKDAKNEQKEVWEKLRDKIKDK